MSMIIKLSHPAWCEKDETDISNGSVEHQQVIGHVKDVTDDEGRRIGCIDVVLQRFDHANESEGREFIWVNLGGDADEIEVSAIQARQLAALLLKAADVLDSVR
jgi:hypothetical protein